MAKPNYRQAKRQKELARKTRQQEKEKRRAERVGGPADGEGADPAGAVPPDGSTPSQG